MQERRVCVKTGTLFTHTMYVLVYKALQMIVTGRYGYRCTQDTVLYTVLIYIRLCMDICKIELRSRLTRKNRDLPHNKRHPCLLSSSHVTTGLFCL